MIRSPRQVLIAALLTAVGVAAVAQTPAPSTVGNVPTSLERMGRGDPAQMQQRRTERMTHFKETLQISPAQEGAWSAWTASMQPPANWKRPDRSEFERLPTPERIDRMRALRAERIARMDQRAEATKAFYATLNPVQKRVFDVETAHLLRGRRGDGDGGREGNHRHHMG